MFQICNSRSQSTTKHIASTEIPTMYPSYLPRSTSIPFIVASLIEDTFVDDFLCDADKGINGWSNCNNIPLQEPFKYHGPLNNNISNELYREFKCNRYSSHAQISFSLAFDCYNAFVDDVQLWINDKEQSHYNTYPIQNTTTDPFLINISSTCDQWFIRHITYSLSLTNNEPFQMKFVAFLKSNHENIVIYDIQIQCIAQPTYSPSFDCKFIFIYLNSQFASKKKKKQTTLTVCNVSVITFVTIKQHPVHPDPV